MKVLEIEFEFEVAIFDEHVIGNNFNNFIGKSQKSKFLLNFNDYYGYYSAS